MSTQIFAGDQAHVLVVDDDLRHGQLLNLLEENLGIKVFTVQSCKDAIHAIKTENFDLVLMDYRMPETNGAECTNCLRQLLPDAKKSLPIIAVTGHTTDGIRQLCLDSGMDDFLPKPFTINALQALLNNHLNR